MPGSKTNAMNRKEVLAAVRGMSPSKDFVWDGVDEAERPATRQKLQAGVNASRRRGRPVSDVTKEQVAIRFNRDVLSAFRASGPGWQTRMNEALKDWLRTHSSV